jgi:hypothetical protein
MSATPVEQLFDKLQNGVATKFQGPEPDIESELARNMKEGTDFLEKVGSAFTDACNNVNLKAAADSAADVKDAATKLIDNVTPVTSRDKLPLKSWLASRCLFFQLFN